MKTPEEVAGEHVEIILNPLDRYSVLLCGHAIQQYVHKENAMFRKLELVRQLAAIIAADREQREAKA